MKKFLIYLLVIVVAVSLGFAIFYLVRDDEVITISHLSLYKDAGDQFDITVNIENEKRGTEVDITSSNTEVVSYNKDVETKQYTAHKGGVARINFQTNNANFRNLSCDVVVGDGSIEYPFYISTAEQLAAIGMGEKLEETTISGEEIYAGRTPYEKYRSDMYYKLVTDIDLSTFNNGYWIPLRTLTGKIDGNGLTIKNLNINIKALSDLKANNNTLITDDDIKTDNVGFIREIADSGEIYNIKMSSIIASNVGGDAFGNFGIVSAVNNGLIERVEITDAFLSIKSQVFGGITAINESTDYGSGDSYTREIARIDTCSVSMILGQKESADGDIERHGAEGIIGGIIGQNKGGELIYSYANGAVYFTADPSIDNNKIIYGGLIGENTYADLGNDHNGNYVSGIHGSKIKDCYSSIVTHILGEDADLTEFVFAGAIGTNNDYSDSYFEGDPNKAIVNNYIVGVYYNLDALNYDEKIANQTKEFKGIGKFTYNTSKTIAWQDTEMIVKGLTRDEMYKTAITGNESVRENYKSHMVKNVNFNNSDGLGTGYEIIEDVILWLFDDVWYLDQNIEEVELTAENVDTEMHKSLPYLDYSVRYRTDGFERLGSPIIENNVYKFVISEDYDIEPEVKDVVMNVGDTLTLKVIPAVDVTWESSNPDCVSVDEDGKITALQPSYVVITARTSSGKIADIYVRVKGLDTYDINPNCADPITLKVDDEYQLNPIGYINSYPISPAPNFLFGSENSLIATVSSTGKIKAEGVGTCKISIQFQEVKKYITVEVEEKTSTTPTTMYQLSVTNLSNNDLTGKVGDIGKLEVEVTDSFGNPATLPQTTPITFKSNNDNIATVDANGNYELKKVGETTFTVYVMAESGTKYIANVIRIKVKVIDLGSSGGVTKTIQFKNDEYYTYVGSKINFANEIINTTGGTPSFISQNQSYAKFDNSTITALKPGNIQITVSYSDGSGNYSDTCDLIIREIELTPSERTVNLKIGDTKTINITSNISTSGLTFIEEDPNGVYEEVSKTNYSITIKATATGTGRIKVKVPNTTSRILISVIVSDPTEIYTLEDLQNVRNNLSGNYKLCADIDMKGINWTPIGTSTKPFTGSLVSKSATTRYTISNFKVNSSYVDAGLFGYVDSKAKETFKGFNVKDVTISSATQSAGALVGNAKNSKISDIHISNVNITSDINAGGIVGYLNTNSSLFNSKVSGNCNILTSTNKNEKCAGGAVGRADGKIIEQVSIIGSNKSIVVKTQENNEKKVAYAGGLVGYAKCKITDIIVNGVKVSNRLNDDRWESICAGGIAGCFYDQKSTSIQLLKSSVDNSDISGCISGGAIGYLWSTRTIRLIFDGGNVLNGYKACTYGALSKSSKETVDGYTPASAYISVGSTVNATGHTVGGLVGNLYGMIKDSYTSATVKGTNAGGVKSSVGLIAGMTKSASNSKFDVENGKNAVECGIVFKCYSNGKIAEGSKGISFVIPNVHNRGMVSGVGLGLQYLFESGKGASYQDEDDHDFAKAKQSADKMKNPQTYREKKFDENVWSLQQGAYATFTKNYSPEAVTF